MDNIDVGKIPKQILWSMPVPDDVSIIVGENGSGKSTFLNSISKHFLRNGKYVIAIANSVYDKFDSRHQNFSCLRWRTGRTHAKTVLKNAIVKMAKSDFFNYKNSLLALDYVGFDSKIGIILDSLADDYEVLLMRSSFIPSEIDKIIYTIKSYLRRSNYNDNTANNFASPVWLEINNKDYAYSDEYSLTELLVWEADLKSIGAISGIDVFL